MKTSEALAIAKKIVGRDYTEAYSEGKERFICCALMAASDKRHISRDEYIRVAAMVESRLKPYPTLEQWLESKGVHRYFRTQTQRDEFIDQVQQHRHAWLDLMIAEFKAKGD